MKKYFLTSIAAGAVVMFGASAVAGTYEALCGGTKCTVYLSASEIRSPFGSIKPQRVLTGAEAVIAVRLWGLELPQPSFLGRLGYLVFWRKIMTLISW